MKIMKDNKRFKRTNERKLNRLNTEINQLNSLVNHSLTVVKKERERFKQEKQEGMIKMFQFKAAQAVLKKNIETSSSDFFQLWLS